MSEIVTILSKSRERDVDFSHFADRILEFSELDEPYHIRSDAGRCEVKIGIKNSKTGFFDGIGVFGDELYLSGDTPPWSESGRGNFLIVESRDGKMHVGIDPLGTYPLFYYQDKFLLGFSNNVFLLREALACIGINIKKTNSLFSMFVALGAAPNGMTGFEGISILQAGQSIAIDSDNSYKINKLSLRDLMYSDRKYDDLLEETANNILSNIRAISNGPFDVLSADLSGGMDSRLVVSSILKEGVENRFLFSTANTYPNPDANTAALIRQRLNLRRAGSLRPEKETGLSPFGRMRRNVGRVGGLMERHFLLPVGEAESDSGAMRLGGALGELMREFWRHKSGSHLGCQTPMLGQLETMAERSSLIQPSVARAQQLSVIQRANEIVLDGVEWEDVPDAFYLTSRNNYHFGVTWKISRRRFHPLYSTSAIKAAHALPKNQRRANRVGFDLMSRFFPILVKIPFAEKSWSSLVMPNAPSPITKASPPFGIPNEARINPYPSSRSKRKVSSVERQMLREGYKSSSIRTVSLMESVRAECKLDMDSISDMFNPDALRYFMKLSPEVLVQKPNAAALFRVLGAFIWANDLELAGKRWTPV